jgi:hypothetical protein
MELIKVEGQGERGTAQTSCGKTANVWDRERESKKKKEGDGEV